MGRIYSARIGLTPARLSPRNSSDRLISTTWAILTGGVHRDVDPAALEQAHRGAVEVACLGENFLRESLRRWRPRSQAFWKRCDSRLHKLIVGDMLDERSKAIQDENQG